MQLRSGQMCLDAGAAVVLALAVSACSTPATRLPVPVFTRTFGLPAFVVECRNTTVRPISPVDAITTLRLDGVIITSPGTLGSYLGGPRKSRSTGRTKFGPQRRAHRGSTAQLSATANRTRKNLAWDKLAARADPRRR